MNILTYIPTRDELTGRHPRIICIDGDEIQQVEAKRRHLHASACYRPERGPKTSEEA